MKTAPFFSVVIPLYNKRKYIGRAVDSVLRQTFADFELIVVDDGSTDGSGNVLSGIADPRLHVIRQQNQGEGPARNTGMLAARGAWIALLDADDAWMPDHLTELARVAQAFPDSGLISTRSVEAVGDLVPADTGAADMPMRKVDYFLEASQEVGFINSTSAAVRGDAFRTLGGFSAARAGADLEYWARVALDYPVAISTRTTCVYYRDTGGVMAGLVARNAGARLVPPRQLRDLSASVALLCSRAETDPVLWSNPSVVAYVNSRLTNGIKGALFRGDVHYARALSPFLLEPMVPRTRLYARVAAMPPVLTRMGILLYRGAKRLRRPGAWFRGRVEAC